jgi:glycosyltransferase involved in cell wall biosynthesis
VTGESSVAGSAPSAGTVLEVLVVGWFPAADDPIKGRFIADQAQALASTGRVRPTVVTFEALGSAGDMALRTRAAEAWPPAVQAAVETGHALARSAATGPPAIPVLRLGVTGGTTTTATWTNQAEHRERALGAYLAARGRPPAVLVHAHVGYPDGAAVAAVARPRNLPYVLTEHATYLDRQLAVPAQREAYGRAARGAARVIAVGPGLARQILDAFPDLGERVVVIPNTVDVAAFRPVGAADRDPDELLWVGYRSVSKGTPTLLRAFAEVRRQRPRTRLRLIGRSPTDAEEAEWHRLAADLGITDAVRFDPPVPDRAPIVDAMARAACFVHASTAERFGIVAVEALASGLPVVATESGGVPEIMGPQPRRFGAVVPASAPEALAAAVLETLDRRAEFDPHDLRAWVESRYGAAAVAQRLADLYDEVLAEAAPPTPQEDPVRQVQGTSPPPGGPLLDGPVVILALDRAALDRALARQPAWVVAGAHLVTCGPPAPGAHLVPPDLAASMTRLLAGPFGVRHLPAAGRRLLDPVIRRRQDHLEQRLVPRLGAVLRGALDAAVGAAPDRAWLVCLGGLDVLVATALGDPRAQIAPGGLRWLGDRLWAQQGAPPAASAS